MATVISCPKCGRLHRVRGALAGKRVRCSNCQAPVAVRLPVRRSEVMRRQCSASASRPSSSWQWGSASAWRPPGSWRRPGRPLSRLPAHRRLWPRRRRLTPQPPGPALPDHALAAPAPAAKQKEDVIHLEPKNDLYGEYRNPAKADLEYLDRLVAWPVGGFDKAWKDGGKYYVGLRWQLVGGMGEPLSQDADCLSYVWELSPEGAKNFAEIHPGTPLVITGRCKGTRPARGIGDMIIQLFFAEQPVEAAKRPWPDLRASRPARLDGILQRVDFQGQFVDFRGEAVAGGHGGEDADGGSNASCRPTGEPRPAPQGPSAAPTPRSPRGASRPISHVARGRKSAAFRAILSAPPVLLASPSRVMAWSSLSCPGRRDRRGKR